MNLPNFQVDTSSKRTNQQEETLLPGQWQVTMAIMKIASFTAGFDRSKTNVGSQLFIGE
jgi:hypothetical protein